MKGVVIDVPFDKKFKTAVSYDNDLPKLGQIVKLSQAKLCNTTAKLCVEIVNENENVNIFDRENKFWSQRFLPLTHRVGASRERGAKIILVPEINKSFVCDRNLMNW